MRFSGWRERLRGRPRWDDVVLWALDLETSGLRAADDRILSIGMVPIRHGVIRYGERFATLVRPPSLDSLSMEGLGAHHLLPGDLAGAPPLADVLPLVEPRIGEGLLLLHFADLDLAFLKQAYRRAGRQWPGARVVDTVDLVLQMHRLAERWVPYPPPPRTSLAAARASLGLPAHPQHDALADAVATAELFLALRSRLALGTLKSSFR